MSNKMKKINRETTKYAAMVEDPQSAAQAMDNEELEKAIYHLVQEAYFRHQYQKRRKEP